MQDRLILLHEVFLTILMVTPSPGASPEIKCGLIIISCSCRIDWTQRIGRSKFGVNAKSGDGENETATLRGGAHLD